MNGYYNTILHEALGLYDNAQCETNGERMYNGLIVDDIISDDLPDSAWTSDKSGECVCYSTKWQYNNGDKLRSMTNEELARYLWIETDRMTPEEWLDWLNST